MIDVQGVSSERIGSDAEMNRFQSYLKMSTLVGCPVQIVFADAHGSETSLTTSGILEEVQETGFTVDLMMPITLVASGRPAYFRMVSKEARIQFTSLVQAVEATTRLLCQVPEQMDYTERRSRVIASVRPDSAFLAGGSALPAPPKMIRCL